MSFDQLRSLVLPQNADPALGYIDDAAVIEIVQPESRAPVSLHGEVAARDAEILPAPRIYVEGSSALAQHQARGFRPVLKRKIIKLHHGIFREKGHRPIFKLDFRASMVGGQHVALPDRQI